MHITELSVKGFRSLKDVRWKPGALNVLIGPNGGGKTNLLKVLEMLSAGARGRLDEFVKREGGMLALAWDGEVDVVTFELNSTLLGSNADGDLSPLQAKYEIHFPVHRSDHFALKLEQFLFNDHRLLFRQGEEQEIQDRDGDVMGIPNIDIEQPLLSRAFTTIAAPEIFQLQSNLVHWSIYQHFDTTLNAPVRGAVVTRHDTIVEPDGQNLVEVLHTLYTNSREFKRDLDSALRAAFGEEFEELVFRPASDQRIQLGIRWKNLSRVRSAADLSDGTLRFLFLMAILANPEPPPLIAIDEPEAGLHPSMLPIIAEYAVSASEKTQVIFSTHSVSMLDAFRDVTPTTTVVECHDGATTLRTLDGDDLAYWRKEYTLGELFRSGELENMAHETEASE